MSRLTALTVRYVLALDACSPKDFASNQAQTTSAPAAQAEGVGLIVKTAYDEMKVPQNPGRIAVYDLGMLDTLNKLNVKASLPVGTNRLPYLDEYFKAIKPASTLFEPDYEALGAYRPQLIIVGSHAAKAFDKLNEITPIIGITTETANLKESSKERIDALAQVFSKQAEADKLKTEIDASFDAAETAAQGKGRSLVVLVNSGKMSAFGLSSRLDGWLHKDIGVPAVGGSIKEGSRDQPISLEYSREKNSGQLFVLDRGTAVGEEGQAAKDVLNNPPVAEADAWKEGQMAYLVPETYLAAGDVQELLNASKQVAGAFNAAK